MFKTEKSAKYALLGLMAFLSLSLPAFYLRSQPAQACMVLGLELILYWGYLNPWILQEKYLLFFVIDTSKMIHNRFLIIGGLILAGSIALIVFG